MEKKHVNAILTLQTKRSPRQVKNIKFGATQYYTGQPSRHKKGDQERAKHTDRTWEKRLQESQVKITVNVTATFKS